LVSEKGVTLLSWGIFRGTYWCQSTTNFLSGVVLIVVWFYRIQILCRFFLYLVNKLWGLSIRHPPQSLSAQPTFSCFIPTFRGLVLCHLHGRHL
jgi:hypothetical protein